MRCAEFFYGATVPGSSNEINPDEILYSIDRPGTTSTASKYVKYLYSQNRLVREDNQFLNKSVSREYDLKGNVVKITQGTYQPDNAVISGTSKTLIYSGDRLMSYDGKSCVYDDMGNPKIYLGKTVEWQCGTLKRAAPQNFYAHFTFL